MTKHPDGSVTFDQWEVDSIHHALYDSIKYRGEEVAYGSRDIEMNKILLRRRDEMLLLLQDVRSSVTESAFRRLTGTKKEP